MFKILINSFVFSIIDYCFPIWGKISQTNLTILKNKINSCLGGYFYPYLCNKFNKLNRIAHNYQNEQFNIVHLNYTELWEKCNLLSVHERLQYFNAITAYKAISTNLVPDLSELFIFGVSDRTRKVILPNHNTEIYKKSPIFQAMVSWNSLNFEAREFGLSLNRFKRVVDTWLLAERDDEFVPR